jgi:hypothetical protein
MWRSHQTYQSIVVVALQHGCTNLDDILNSLHTTLSSWEHEEFGSV